MIGATTTMISKIKTFNDNIILIIKHLFNRLIHSPLLLGWIILGTIIDTITRGYKGFENTIINLLLLAFYTVIIKFMTDKNKIRPISRIKHPKAEIFTGILVEIFIFIGAIIANKQVPIFLSSGATDTNITKVFEKIIFDLNTIGIPKWAVIKLFNASLTVAFELIPIIILCLLWRHGFKEMGFVPGNFFLTAVLVAITIILGLPSKVIFQKPFYETITLFFIQIFVNGLPEELMMRGYFLPRFEAILKDPINALVIVSILFNLMHIPTYLPQGLNLSQSILLALDICSPTGLIWGYLYLKTRSIIPGIIWHTSNANLGIIFIWIK